MQELLRPFSFDLGGFALSAALVFTYHAWLRWRLRRDPDYTVQAINNLARRSWVEGVMTAGNKDILAVQTLRNSTMAASFFASTAILLIIGVLNLTEHGEGIGEVIQSLASHDANAGEALWSLKLLPLVVDLFWAFFSFSLAIRMYNHVGYLINANTPGRAITTPAYVAVMLNRGGWYYSLGMRSYYLAVPLVLWLFGPVWMVVATAVLIAVLHHVDRSPADAAAERPGDAPAPHPQAEPQRAVQLRKVAR